MYGKQYCSNNDCIWDKAPGLTAVTMQGPIKFSVYNSNVGRNMHEIIPVLHAFKKENMKALKEAIKDKDAVFVDVRSRSEFESGHIQGAMNIPLDELMGRMDELDGAGGPLVLYCRSGNRSGMALHILKEAGWDNLYNGGGIDDLGHILN